MVRYQLEKTDTDRHPQEKPDLEPHEKSLDLKHCRVTYLPIRLGTRTGMYRYRTVPRGGM